MNPFNEDNLVEKTVVKMIKKIWGDKNCHINAFADADNFLLGREHQGEVVLKKYLLLALQKINPGLPAEVLEQAMDAITRDRSNLSLVKANQEIYKLLRDGVNVNVVKENGETTTERVRFFDFENPEKNHFLAVSQMWVVGEMYTRRPDVILFVNGIPLVLLELKASHKSLLDAYKDNIKDYKDTIPKIFWYNMAIIISNGIENKFGSLTSPYEFFNEWKKAESEKEKPKTEFALKIIEFLKNNYKIIEEKEYKPKEYNCIIQINSNLGPIQFLTQAKDKKTISESDLIKLLSNAQSQSLPALMIYTEKIGKKSEQYLEKHSSVLKAKKID